MSNVYKRNHSETGLEYYDNCTDLYIELRRIVLDTKVFPKRTLYTDVVPILNTYAEMRDYIVKAQTRFPSDEANLTIRKEYIQRAIEAAHVLMTKIQDAIWGIETVDCDKMEHVGRLLQKEIKLLKSWKRSSRILTNKK